LASSHGLVVKAFGSRGMGLNPAINRMNVRNKASYYIEKKKYKGSQMRAPKK